MSVAALAISVAAITSPALAQRAKTRPARPEPQTFQIGEKVEVQWGFKWYAGVVTAIDDFLNLVHVRYSVDGDEQTWMFHRDPNWIRKLPGGAPPAGALVPVNPGAPANPASDAAPAAEFPLRTWTDHTGKYKVEARYGGRGPGGVQLKKPDGKTIEIPLEKLSKEDQAFVEGLAAALANSPRSSAPRTQGSGGSESTGGPDRKLIPEPAKRIEVVSTPNWSLTPDGVTPLDLPAGTVQIALKDPRVAPARGAFVSQDDGLDPKHILLDHSRGQALVACASLHGPSRRIRLYRCDLKAGRFLGQLDSPGGHVPRDLSRSGALLVGVPEIMDLHSRSIAVSKLEEKSLALFRRFESAAVGGLFGPREHYFASAYFVGEDKLLTVSDMEGLISLWNIEDGRRLWLYKASSSVIVPALSPGHQQMAVKTQPGLAILDTTSGKTLGTIDLNEYDGTAAFSADGKWLGFLTSHNVRVWNVTTGKLAHEVWFPEGHHGGSLSFLSDDFVLVDHRYVIDLPKKVVLWDYGSSMATDCRAVAGGKFWHVEANSPPELPSQLIGRTLLTAPVKAKSESLVAGDLLALKRGSRVSINVDLPTASGDDLVAVAKHLTDEVKSNGFALASSSPLTLRASIEPDKHPTGKTLLTLTLKENDTVLWTARQYGESPRMFLSSHLPTSIARHPPGGAFGKSELK
jgi:hypothetical protein